MTVPRETDITTPQARWVRYVLWSQAEDYLRLGWCPCDALAGTSHEQFSVMMLWLCDCVPVEPQR